jgi:hypothetical protein
MPIPKLSRNGVLPEGIHNCSLMKVQKRFGFFTQNDCRVKLFEKLQSLVETASSTRLVTAVIIDGSFVTNAQNPNDIALILVLPEDFDFKEELSPFAYNAVSRKRLRKRYGFDVFLVRQNSGEYTYHVSFFSQIKGSKKRKGMLRVWL